MIPRRLRQTLTSALAEAPAVALLGPRQVGKTTPALDVAGTRPAVYLDLESEADREALLAHPVAGASWEGLVIESLIGAAPSGIDAYFFRTSAGAEIDLLLELPGHRQPWAIEIKRGLAPKIDRSFHLACESVRRERRLVVYGGVERFPLADGVEAVSLVDVCRELSAAQRSPIF